jgi:hypothetical protein
MKNFAPWSSNNIAKASFVRSVALLLFLLGASVQSVSGQCNSTPERPATTHSFWDRTNLALFSGVAAARAIDYSSTLNMRRRGRQEILLDNQIVDNHPLFAGIEAGGTVLSVGVSYWLHRTNHHRLERWVSVVHIGLTTVGGVRNYSLQTAHPSTSP